jgi:hypothetical protein
MWRLVGAKFSKAKKKWLSKVLRLTTCGELFAAKKEKELRI